MQNAKLIIASGPVIVKNDKVLLNISGKDSFWKFCGGKVQNNETLQEAAIRRAKEELNININIKNTSPFLLYALKKINNIKIDVILSHFLAKTASKVIPGKDVKKWAWLPINTLDKEDLAPNIIPALRHFGFIKK